MTFDVNYRAGMSCAMQAKAAGVRSFVFASSCSVYGFADDGPRTEQSEVSPLTAYAKSKVLTEQALRSWPTPGIPRVVPAVRDRVRDERPAALDLVLNDFVASAVSTAQHPVLSDGTALAAADQCQGHGAGHRVGGRT